MLRDSIKKILLFFIVVFSTLFFLLFIPIIYFKGFEGFKEIIEFSLQQIIANYKSISGNLETIINSEYFWVLKLVFVVSIFQFIMSILLTKKPRIKNEYIRDCENVIDPIFAEVLIDSKIGAKELIMTCILSSIKKRAVEVIDNDTLKYCGDKFLNEREKIVISMIFKNSRTIKILK